MKIFLGTLMLVAFSAVLGNSSGKADYYYYRYSQSPAHTHYLSDTVGNGFSAVGNVVKDII
jgi:hypothetical protein